MIDGARHALAGYLYQFLTVAALRACPAGDETGTSPPTLLTIVARGTLIHEQHNQDAVVTTGLGATQEQVAVQVKHTGDPPADIDVTALAELLYGCDQSRRHAEDAGVDLARYFLVTNRRLDTAAAEIWNGRDGSKLEAALKQRKRGSEWMKGLLKPYAGQFDVAVTAWKDVLTRLEPVQQLSPAFALDRLAAYARSHGVLAAERDGALDRLTGAIMRLTAGGKAVEVDWTFLNRHLVGAGDARSMVLGAPGGMADVSRHRVETGLEPMTEHRLTRRGLLRELRQQVEQFSVTLVHGGGGTGKSVLALQHLAGVETGPVVVSLGADEAADQQLAGRLRRLRSESEFVDLQDDALGRAVERLQAANPGAPVVLLVNVDAVDETGPRDRGPLRELVRWWLRSADEAMPVRLILSCRNHSQTDREAWRILKELVPEATDRARVRVGVVSVGDFDPGELQDAARLLGEEPERRLLADPAVGEDRSSDTFGAVAAGSRVSPTIGESLRHPVVWGAYATLSKEERADVLSGTPGGTARLAVRLLDRFLQKCRVRRPDAWLEQHILAALRGVARLTSGSAPPYTRPDAWYPGCDPHLVRDQPEALYREALTYGLITEDARAAWRWRHTFLADALVGGGV